MKLITDLVSEQDLNLHDLAANDVQDDHSFLGNCLNALVVRSVATLRLRPRVKGCAKIVAASAAINNLLRVRTQRQNHPIRKPVRLRPSATDSSKGRRPADASPTRRLLHAWLWRRPRWSNSSAAILHRQEPYRRKFHVDGRHRHIGRESKVRLPGLCRLLPHS
jgi:hypothetical protein